MFLVGAAGLAGLLLWGLAGLPDFGHYPGPYGDILNRDAVGERHVTNVVAAVVFDYRGFDTLGEELILFTSVSAVALLLREAGAREATARDLVVSYPVRAIGLLAVGPVVVLGLYVVTFGVVTPGGGFQGGVVLAAGLVLVWAAGSYRAFDRVSPTPLVDLAEGIGAGFYPALGVATLVAGGAFLENLLPLGSVGSPLGGGTIPLLNLATALAVSAAIVLLISEFLQELAVPLEDARK